MTTHIPRLMIVEDDRATRRFLLDNLAADGYRPLAAPCARDGRQLLAEIAVDLLIIDLGLPDGDGLELLGDVRAGGARDGGPIDPHTPVLILSGRAGELDRVRGFERGCDDYLVKPFSYAELRGRVAALLRRDRARPRPGRLRVGALVVDPASRAVRVGDQRIGLSKKEYALLRALASQPTRVFTREELLRSVWGFQSLGATRTLDSHASRLRRKLSVDGHAFVVNVWGVGYRLIDGDAE